MKAEAIHGAALKRRSVEIAPENARMLEINAQIKRQYAIRKQGKNAAALARIRHAFAVPQEKSNVAK